MVFRTSFARAPCISSVDIPKPTVSRQVSRKSRGVFGAPTGFLASDGVKYD